VASFSLHICNLFLGVGFSRRLPLMTLDDERPWLLDDAFIQSQSIADGFEPTTFVLRLRAGTSAKTWSARTT